MFKKIVALSFVIAIALTMVSCSNTSKTSNTVSEKSNEDSNTVHPQITVWMGSWWQAAVPDLQQRFASDNTGYSAKIVLQPINNYLQNVITSIASGSPPDVVDLDISMVPSTISQKLLSPLDGVMKEYNLKSSDFTASVYNAVVSKGKPYGLPDRQNTNMLFFNKTMFDAAGVAYPTKDWKYTDLLNAAQKLTIPSKQQYGFGIAAAASDASNVMSSFSPILWSYGGDYLNKDMTKSTLSTKQSVAAIKFYSDLYRTYKVVPDGTLNYTISRDLLPMVENGNLAMCPMNSNNLVTLVEPAMKAKGYQWGVVVFPQGGNAVAQGYAMTIPATAKNMKEAGRFVSWFVKPDVISKQNIVMPAVLEAQGKGDWTDSIYDPYYSGAKYSKPLPPSPHWTEVQNVVITDLQKTLGGTMTADEAGADMDNQINTILKKS